MRGPVRSVPLVSVLAAALLLPPGAAEAGRKARFRDDATLTVRVIVVAPCDPADPACVSGAQGAGRPRVREETNAQGVRLRTVEY